MIFKNNFSVIISVLIFFISSCNNIDNKIEETIEELATNKHENEKKNLEKDLENLEKDTIQIQIEN